MRCYPEEDVVIAKMLLLSSVLLLFFFLGVRKAFDKFQVLVDGLLASATIKFPQRKCINGGLHRPTSKLPAIPIPVYMPARRHRITQRSAKYIHH